MKLETDEITLLPRSLQKGKHKLKKPLQTAIRLVFTQPNINKLLQSPDILALLSKLNVSSKDYLSIDEDSIDKFGLPQFKILDNNRSQFQIELRSENEEKPLLIKVETEININKGRQINLIETAVTVNEEQVAPQFVEGIEKTWQQRLDLRNAGR